MGDAGVLGRATRVGPGTPSRRAPGWRTLAVLVAVLQMLAWTTVLARGDDDPGADVATGDGIAPTRADELQRAPLPGAPGAPGAPGGAAGDELAGGDPSVGGSSGTSGGSGSPGTAAPLPSPPTAPAPSPGGGSAPTTAAPAPTPAPAPPTTAAPQPLVFRTWAVENESSNHRWSRAQAEAAARAHDVITALPHAYKGMVPAMKRANPNVLVLGYLNAAYSPRSQPNAYPAAWYARDAQGNKITSNGYGNFLMNPRHPGWIADRVASCQAIVRDSGYDGCMLDLMTEAPLFDGYGSAKPIDPRTGRVWTIKDWLADIGSLGGEIRKGVRPKVVIGNALGNGRRYFRSGSPTRSQLSFLDGGIAEGWLRQPGDPASVFPSESEWKADVDMLVDAANRGQRIYTLTKIWTSSRKWEQEKVHEFALASFLLGDNGTHYFAFQATKDGDTTANHPWWDIDLGPPTEAYGKAGGVYRRSFDRGLVLVNPTGSSRTVALGSRMRTLRGESVTEVTLRPNTGLVLTK